MLRSRTSRRVRLSAWNLPRPLLSQCQRPLPLRSLRLRLFQRKERERLNSGGNMAMLVRRWSAVVLAGLLSVSAGTIALLTAWVSPAFADSQPFEVYCPGTPVGTIVLNDATSTGTITPASPTAGSQFNLTNFQTTVNLPNSLAYAVQAIGNSVITGTASTKVDATGATPASLSGAAIQINAPIPNPVPAAGVSMQLPNPPETLGPFTASGGAISLTLDSSISISVQVSGASLSLTCTTYPNNTIPKSGITTVKPSASPAAPVIATASASGGGGGGSATPKAPTASTAATTATTADPTATTAATPSSAPTDGSLASTGPGPHLWLVALVGFVVLYVGSVALALVERPRSLLRRVLRLAHVGLPREAPVMTPAPAADGGGALPAVGPTQTPPVARRVGRAPYPRADRAPGLWFDGWEPTERT
jgi:hypothetical protein